MYFVSSNTSGLSLPKIVTGITYNTSLASLTHYTIIKRLLIPIILQTLSLILAPTSNTTRYKYFEQVLHFAKQYVSQLQKKGIAFEIYTLSNEK